MANCPTCNQEAKQVGTVYFCMTLDCPVCMVKAPTPSQGEKSNERRPKTT